MKRGDQVVIYRTSDGQGPAQYRSVVTTMCTIFDVKTRGDFKRNEAEFMEYTKYSIFGKENLRSWFRKYPNLVVIKMLYNAAFTKRVIRKDLVEQVGLDAQARWSLLLLTDKQFKKMVELGQADERYIID